MRANEVEAAIARYREQKKMRAIGIARKWGARTWGFYCISKTKNRKFVFS